MHDHHKTTQCESARAVGQWILRRRSEIAVTFFSMELARQPQPKELLSDSARSKSLRDAREQLSNLSAALLADNPEIFIDYVGWAKVALTSRGWLLADLRDNLRNLCEAIRFELPNRLAELAISFVQLAIERLPLLPDDAPSFIDPQDPHAPVIRQLIDSLVQGDRPSASRSIANAVEDGTSIRDVYLGILQPALYEIGRLWQINQISVGREHYCTAAIQSILSQVRCYPDTSDKQTGKVVVATCVEGDQHDIGIRMVADFFDMAGWQTHGLGANMPADDVISELIARKADVLAVSASIGCHVPALSELISAVRSNQELQNVRILVGGRPFQIDQNLWSTVHADGAAPDPEHAVAKAQSWFDA